MTSLMVVSVVMSALVLAILLVLRFKHSRRYLIALESIAESLKAIAAKK